MSEILIPLPAIANVGGVSPGNTSQTATDAPLDLATLPRGVLLSGVIIGRDGRGTPLLRTDKGDLPLKSDLPLEIGARVVLRLDGGTEGLRARILSIDGAPPPPSTPAAPVEDVVVLSAGAEEGIEQSAAFAKPPTPALLKAVVISAAPPQGEHSATALQPFSTITLKPTFPQPQQVAPQLTVSPLRIESAAPPPLVAITAESAAATSPQAPSPATPAVNATITSQTGLPPQAQAPASATSSLPAAPAQTASATASTTGPATLASPAAAPALLTGTVVRDGASPYLQLQTPIGTLRLPPEFSAAPGTQLSFEILEPAATATGGATLPASEIDTAAPVSDPRGLSDLNRAWQALDRLGILASALPPDAGAAVALQRAIPSTGPQLTNGLLFFISALRGGDLKNWLGDKVTSELERNHPALTKKLSAEFGSMRGLLQEPPPNQPWQLLTFPLMHEGALHQLRLFIKRDEEKKPQEQQKKRGRDTRFVVELELSALGSMQLDGLVRAQEETLLFDVMIRTHAPLEDEIQRDIEQLYHSAAEVTGFKGTVGFQAVRTFPVNPLEEMLSPGAQSIMA